MNPVEVLPLLVVVILLLSAGGASVDRMEIGFDGNRAVTSIDDVLVVAGGTATIPEDTAVNGTIYVIGGSVEARGYLEGDITVLAGNLTVAGSGTVSGTLQAISGDTDVESGATIGDRTSLPEAESGGAILGGIGGLVLQFFGLAAAGVWLSRRRPSLLAGVGGTITEHALVSGVIGGLAAVSLLVLFVYMAFTLLLLPLSILGLIGEVVVILYAYVVYGYLIGEQLPIERRDLATVVGIAGFLGGLELLGFVPILGDVILIALILIGFGAVVLSYFGLRQFEPARIPDGEVP